MDFYRAEERRLDEFEAGSHLADYVSASAAG